MSGVLETTALLAASQVAWSFAQAYYGLPGPYSSAAPGYYQGAGPSPTQIVKPNPARTGVMTVNIRRTPSERLREFAWRIGANLQPVQKKKTAGSKTQTRPKQQKKNRVVFARRRVYKTNYYAFRGYRRFGYRSRPFARRFYRFGRYSVGYD